MSTARATATLGALLILFAGGCGTTTSSSLSPSVASPSGGPGDAQTSLLTFGKADPATGHFLLQIIGADGSGEARFAQGEYDVTRWAHSGDVLAATSFDGDHVFPTLLDAGGMVLRQLRPDSTLNLGAMAWSRDDTWLAFEAWDESDEQRGGIYLMHPDGSELHRLTQPGVPGDFSPDDQQLVFTSGDGGDELWVVNADGTGAHRVGGLKVGLYPGFMPDGAIYASVGGDLAIIDPATGNARTIQLPGGNVVEPRLSPAGDQFVFSFDPVDADSMGIWATDVDGSGFRMVVNHPAVEDVFPDWVPAG